MPEDKALHRHPAKLSQSHLNVMPHTICTLSGGWAFWFHADIASSYAHPSLHITALQSRKAGAT